jgi:hypothetical protein
VINAAGVKGEMYQKIERLEKKLEELDRKLNGDPLRARYEGAAPTSIRQRINMITEHLWTTRSAPTTTFIQAYEIAAGKFGEYLDYLYQIEKETMDLESDLENQNAPYTPGRIPDWEK